MTNRIKKMRLLILSDSLGQPIIDDWYTTKSNFTYYQDLYGYLLKEDLKTLFDVEFYFRQSLDTEDAINEAEKTIGLRNPDVVIFHIGINDCAPRLFKKNSKSLILNPVFRKITKDVFFRVISRFRSVITKYRKIVYVNSSDFIKNYKEMIRRIEKNNNNIVFYAIGIKRVPEEINKKSYCYNENIKKYNEIIKEIFKENYIDISFLNINQISIDDGIHLNKFGHKKYFELIKEKLKERFVL